MLQLHLLQRFYFLLETMNLSSSNLLVLSSFVSLWFFFFLVKTWFLPLQLHFTCLKLIFDFGLYCKIYNRICKNFLKTFNHNLHWKVLPRNGQKNLFTREWNSVVHSRLFFSHKNLFSRWSWWRITHHDCVVYVENCYVYKHLNWIL